MIEEAIAAAIRRFGKWRPDSWEPEDLNQEAWLAALEAQQEGITDVDELQRRVENHLSKMINRENRRPEIAYSPNGMEMIESVRALRARGMSRARANEAVRLNYNLTEPEDNSD